MSARHTIKAADPPPGSRATFKVCRCCGAQASLRKRLCKHCGVAVIWDAPTAEQAAAYQAHIERREALIQGLVR